MMNFFAIEDLRALGIIELITHPNGDNRIVARQPHAVNLFRMQMPTEIRRDQHHLIAVAFESTRVTSKTLKNIGCKRDVH